MAEAAGLYYELHGPEDAPPLILSPGLGGSAAYWAPNLDALVQEHRVILYDHRGTGRSDRALAENLTVDIMADDVLGLMDALGLDRVNFVGHAAGGAIGLSLALRFPERIDRLAVINGWVAPDPHFARCMELRLELLHNSGVAAFVRAQPIFLYPARWISANFDSLARDEAELIEHFQGAVNVEARINALAAFNIDDRVREIRTHTLLIAAEDDMLVPPSCSEHFAGRMVNAVLADVNGGHACNVTEPRIINSMLRGWFGPSHNAGVE